MNLNFFRLSNAAQAPLPELAPVLELLVPVDVTPEQAAASLLVGADVAMASHHAISRLRVLFNRLSARDLQLLVAGRADGMQWLQRLMETAGKALVIHKENCAAATEAVTAAQQARNRFVGKAMHMMSQARDEAERHESAARSVDSAKAAMVESMVESGLARDHVVRFVDRHFGDDSESHRTAAAEARLRAKALEAYVDDPFRRLDLLDGELAAELQVARQVVSAAAPRPQVDLETAIVARFSGLGGARNTAAH